MSRTELQVSLSLWKRRLAYRQKRVDYWRGDAKAGTRGRRRGLVTKDEAAKIHKWERLRDDANRMAARREQQIADYAPMNERALRFARTLVGVVEQGGNNMGPKVSEIIRANGGVVGEPWCGDFCAFVYRHVGSKAVNRSWASVYLLGRLVGVVKTSHPAPGDLVRFTFSHVGLYVRDLGGGQIETIEGNTGASGAVSDSATGGDGVYVKHRAKSLVLDYRHITR